MGAEQKGNAAGQTTGGIPAAFNGSDRIGARPNTMCIYCCQSFKSGNQEFIAPAITWVPIPVPPTGMPAVVPVCIGHLQDPSKKSKLDIG